MKMFLLILFVLFIGFIFLNFYMKDRKQTKTYETGILADAVVEKREAYADREGSVEATRVWVRFTDESGTEHVSMINSVANDLQEGTSVKIKYTPGKEQSVVRM